MQINCKGTLISLETPLVMGILNLTHDSFFDGGHYQTFDNAKVQTENMIREGATFIDIGATSSKPGSAISDPETELKILVPILEQLLQSFPSTIFSVDTYHSKVAQEALEIGASMINDISGGCIDPKMFATVAQYKAPYVMMHMQGLPENMQADPQYENVVADVVSFFARQLESVKRNGIFDIIIDPGFGFGKTVENNYELLQDLNHFKNLKCPILVGVSRKSMIYKKLNTSPKEALNGTTALHAWALDRGANILRVHDVKAAKECITLWQALQ